MLVNLYENLSWLGFSILSDIQKEGNLVPLALDRVCFGSDGLISDRSFAYLGWTKGF